MVQREHGCKQVTQPKEQAVEVGHNQGLHSGTAQTLIRRSRQRQWLEQTEALRARRQLALSTVSPAKKREREREGGRGCSD
jgi:hypothetical protein